ncbi:hypothetical protein ACEN9X_10655 [Mucilaginibacter sp. Mucisp86]|uniref:hypothetical protein n=1 Tax=Mucilaginibacter sp. Mucisp86 TaxID=3243060 RepID=UPI0039B67F76
MKPRFLFSHKSRLVGYLCLLAYIPLMVLKKILHNGYNNQSPAMRIADNSGLLNSEHILLAIAFILVISGLLFIAFSKEKIEDEQISQLRLDSLQWAVYFNYLLIIISVAFLSNIDFIKVVMINIWTPLVFFIIRFKWVIYRLNRSLKSEII